LRVLAAGPHSVHRAAPVTAYRILPSRHTYPHVISIWFQFLSGKCEDAMLAAIYIAVKIREIRSKKRTATSDKASTKAIHRHSGSTSLTSGNRCLK
jgi:hypothetical protein